MLMVPIYSAVVKDLFEPIVQDILRLVKAQVQKALSKRAGQGLKVRVCQLVNHYKIQHCDLLLTILGHLPGRWIRIKLLPEEAPPRRLRASGHPSHSTSWCLGSHCQVSFRLLKILEHMYVAIYVLCVTNVHIAALPSAAVQTRPLLFPLRPFDTTA